MQEALRDSFPTSLTLSWGQSPLTPTAARAGDLPTPIHMQKNRAAEGLLDLISCCAFCKIRIKPSPSPGRKGVARGLGWGVLFKPVPHLSSPRQSSPRAIVLQDEGAQLLSSPKLPSPARLSVLGICAAGGVCEGGTEATSPERDQPQEVTGAL